MFDFITFLQLHCALAALWCWRPITYSCNSSDTHSTNKLQVFLKVNCCFCSSICVCQLINVFNYLMWCYIWFLALLFMFFVTNKFSEWCLPNSMFLIGHVVYIARFCSLVIFFFFSIAYVRFWQNWLCVYTGTSYDLKYIICGINDVIIPIVMLKCNICFS